MKNYLIILIVTCLFMTSCLTPTPEPQVEDEVVVDKVEESTPVPEVLPEETGVYVATEEVYKTTFSEVEELVLELNSIISRNQFDSWKAYLSESYIEKYGSDEFLSKLSENPVLQDYGIKLKKLKDYFTYVVVPSRSDVVVDEIQFETEDKIKVFKFNNDNKFIIYTLVRDNNAWLITD